MKKILLSAAAFAMVAASALAVAPTTAQAIPAFARQTGAACYSCHFQSFPALTDFGRSFKRDAFTDVGEEALIEDDNLSIPAVLNATLAVHAAYANISTSPTNVMASTPGGYKKGVWSLPIEAPLLIAGRMGKNVGAFMEFDGGASNANNTPVANWQVMSSFDMGNFRVGLNAFNTSFGWTAGEETTAVFGQHDGVLNGGDVSAVVAVGNGNDGPSATAVQTQGLTLWAGNDLWFVGLTGWAPDIANITGGAGISNVGFALIPGIRVRVFPQVAGWDTMIGAGWSAGTAGATNPGTGLKPVGADMWWIDAQAQGDVGNTSIGVYADYAHTKSKTNVDANVFGNISYADIAGGITSPLGKTDGYSIRATVKPIPQWVAELGFGQTKFTPTVGASGKDSLWNIGIQYELYQNFNLKLMYEDQKIDNAYFTGVTGPSAKIKTTTLELDALM